MKATNRMRAAYDALRSKPDYSPKNGVIITEGYLRLEQLLATMTAIEFGVLESATKVSSTERRLAIADAFAIMDIGVGIYQLADGALASVQTLQTFANTEVFNGANGGNLEAIYNGSIFLQISSLNILDSIDAMRFKRVGAAQQGVDLGGGTGVSPDVFVQSSFMQDFPFSPVDPLITISGADTIKTGINLPESINLAADAGFKHYAALMFRGFLLQNGAKFATRSRARRG